MLLVAIVATTVLAVLVVTGVAGYLFERSAQRRDLPHGSRGPGSASAPE